jgi:hypothetical protein
MKTLGPAFLLWANCDSDVRANLQSMATAVDSCVKANEGLTAAHYFKYYLVSVLVFYCL